MITSLDAPRAAARINRLRRMTFDECAWRTREIARTMADRARVRLRAPRWDRRHISRALAPSAMGEEMRGAIAREAWNALNDQLTDRLRRRDARCLLDPAAAGAVRDEILSRWPSAGIDAAMRADAVLNGRYDILGYRGLRFTRDSREAIDWHFDPVHRTEAPRVCWAEVRYLDPAIGDHKIIWELNRHQHWLQLGRAAWLTGDHRYTAAIVRQLGSWLADNPPLIGVNWASMLEIGFRAISWTWALQFLLADAEHAGAGHVTSPWLVDLLVAMDLQLTHLEHHLSHYFSPNTHLTGEALALYVVGQALPEMAASERWKATGRRILLREIDRQILDDGGHVERSTHYQRYTLDFYLLALLTAQRTGDADAIAPLTDAVSRLAEYTRTIADDEGRMPLIGDDDGGMLWPITGRECRDVRDSLAVAAIALARPGLAPWGVPEEAFWIASRAALDGAPRLEDACVDRTLPASRTLQDTGYVVARDARGGHAVFDVGAHGYMNGGHAHADALSLTLNIGHRPLLVDPGTSTYTMNPQTRDRMRSSLNHNTVTVDGQPQSVPAGPFHWRTSVSGRLHASRHGAGFDWAEGSHDGYAPLEHRRTVFRGDQTGWLVLDRVGTRSPASSHDGGARHAATAHWHFDPGWMVHPDAAGRLRATHVDGDEAWLLHDGGEIALLRGDEHSGLGWCAPVYGTLIPTWTAGITREGSTPLSLVTWIGGGADANRSVPFLERVTVSPDQDEGSVAVRLVTGDHTSLFLLRPGEPALRGGACRFLHYETNAAVCHLRTRGQSLVTLDLVDGTFVRTPAANWISVDAGEPLPDLHLTLRDGALELFTSSQRSWLRMHGTAFEQLRSMALNGRGVEPVTRHDHDGLTTYNLDLAR